MSAQEPAIETVEPVTGRRAALAEAALLTEALLRNRARIVFAAQDAPAVSIVIVARGARDLLALTLHRLSAHQLAGPPFEVILVDNASGPRTRALTAQLDGVRLIEKPENIGFGPACNAGAGLARGRHLLFLNPDIDLMPGALAAMVGTFADHAGAGIVGARLVWPGGTLQESGAGFRDDAQVTHPHGRGEPDPFAPAHAVVRDVGYVSGAALMIERALFESLGGFDDLFAPAYFEDTDLCLRCHQAGRRVIVQPRATAIHYENATAAGRADVEALLDRNRARFLERHRRWLFEQGPQATGHATHPAAGPAARDFDPWRLRVLYIDDRVPHLDLGAGLPRANAILNAMARLGYAVTFYPRFAAEPEESQRYRDIDERVEILPAGEEAGLDALVAERRGTFDVLWVSRSPNIAFALRVLNAAGLHPRAFAPRVIFDSEALFSLRDFTARASAEGGGLAADLGRAARAEARGFALADQVVCVSEAEARVLARFSPCNVAVLGHALEPPAAEPAGFPGRDGFLFIGSLAREDQPNVDSLDWFFAQVWPRLRARLPRAALTLIGEVAPSVRARFTREGVRVLGRVGEVGPLFDTARVCLAPTRIAAGIPHKVHEAVARGLPAVATPILASQLGWDDGSGILVRDWQDPEAFAQALVRLHEEAALWERVRAAGLDRIRAECDPDAFRARVRALCEAPTFA